jgi:hypothetical protein
MTTADSALVAARMRTRAADRTEDANICLVLASGARTIALVLSVCERHGNTQEDLTQVQFEYSVSAGPGEVEPLSIPESHVC